MEQEAVDSAEAASSQTVAPAEEAAGMASTSSSNGRRAGPDAGGKPVQASMRRKLTEALQPDSYALHVALPFCHASKRDPPTCTCLLARDECWYCHTG